jgi:hypothetical protein
MRPDLLSWQYEGYPEFHTNRANLLIHIVAVPAFALSSVWFLLSLVAMQWAQAAPAALATLVSFLAQGVGHKREANPPISFAGPADAVSRILAEQFVTFPRFVLSGAFGRALKASASPR